MLFKELEGMVIRSVEKLSNTEDKVYAQSVCDDLRTSVGVNRRYTTIKTVLDRVCEDGHLIREKSGKQFCYRLAVPFSDYIEHQFKRFLIITFGSKSEGTKKFCVWLEKHLKGRGYG